MTPTYHQSSSDRQIEEAGDVHRGRPDRDDRATLLDEVLEDRHRLVGFVLGRPGDEDDAQGGNPRVGRIECE